MSTAVADIDRARSSRWERNVPVFGFPVINGFFLGMSALVLVAFILTGYRELAGLGPVSGMNDAYGWGIWKTFNVMVLTALGSGAFAIGIAAWVFRRKRLHADADGVAHQFPGLCLRSSAAGH
jgi:Polysulphide reductase